LSMGFNVHIGGTDKRCEFPIDFCVRINGEKAAVNVLIRPVPDKFSLDMLDGLETGPKQSFFTIMCALANRGLDRLRYYELALLRIFRPASPGGYQYGTAGGVFEGAHDTARERTFQETREEFKGFEYLGWDLLLAEQVYQSGNIYELQSVGVVIGHIPNPEAVQTEKAEGIEDWKTVPLDTAFNFFDELRRVPLTDPHCIRHDGKIDHGLARLLPRLAKIGIT